MHLLVGLTVVGNALSCFTPCAAELVAYATTLVDVVRQPGGGGGYNFWGVAGKFVGILGVLFHAVHVIFGWLPADGLLPTEY